MSYQAAVPVYPDDVSPSPGLKSALPHTVQWRIFLTVLVVFDGLALAIAFTAAYLLRFTLELPILEALPERQAFYSSVAFWAVPTWVGIFLLHGLYDRRHLFEGFQEYSRVVQASTAGMVAIIIISFLDVSLVISRGWLLLVWGLSILLVAVWRFCLRRLVRQLRRRGFLSQPTLIVGTNEEGRALADQLLENPTTGARIIGFLESEQGGGPRLCGRVPVLGSLGDLEKVVRDSAVSDVIVATTALSRESLLDLYRRLAPVQGVEIRLSSGLFEILTTGVIVQQINSVPLMTPQRVRITGIDAGLKLLLDYVVAILGLIGLSPVFLAIALLVKLDSPGPILHRRQVLGRGGRPFHAFKFRTMVQDADRLLASDPELNGNFVVGHKLKSDPRVTRVGRILRRTSLDELPQLLNVLLGEMSLVGPRMIAPEERFRYGKWQLNLLTVKPGITGPWQVRGRSDIPYEERVRLSMHYIRNYSIWMDLEILLRTVPAVLGARGAY